MESEDSVNEENVSMKLLTNEEVSDNKSGGQSDGTIRGSYDVSLPGIFKEKDLEV